jgi:hypothetical protein
MGRELAKYASYWDIAGITYFCGNAGRSVVAGQGLFLESTDLSPES